MSSTSETGHARNVSNFEALISFCTAYGTTYNPSKTTIKLAALNTLLASAKTTLTAVNTALPPYNNAVNAREIAFAPLSKLVTRIINALASSNVTKQVVEDAKSIARKIQGKRAGEKLPEIPDDPTTPEDESQKSSSVSQMSFDNRVENFEKLIQLLSAQTGYAPNENDLKVTALTTLLADLRTKNTATLTSLAPLSNARIARNTLLYTTSTSLINIALDVKKYIKSLYGATSPQYKQISGLKFSRYPI